MIILSSEFSARQSSSGLPARVEGPPSRGSVLGDGDSPCPHGRGVSCRSAKRDSAERIGSGPGQLPTRFLRACRSDGESDEKTILKKHYICGSIVPWPVSGNERFDLAPLGGRRPQGA